MHSLTHDNVCLYNFKTIHSLFFLFVGDGTLFTHSSVGPNVTSVQAGDFVLTTFMPQCRKCPVCLNPRTNLCEKENGMMVMSKANKKLASDGSKVFGYCGLGTYSEFILVRPSQIVKVG